MPNFISDTVTAQNLAASKSGSMVADAALTSGSIRFLQGKLTVPAGTAIADTFEIVKVPAGAIIIPAFSSILGASAGALSTLAIGFTGDTSAISSALAVSTAGIKHMTASNVGSYKNTTRRSLIATLAGGAMTATVVLYFNIAYSVAE
tara:strand:+ start:855 stop:1298 length:444 start_codon:yes stop_codon:yes gene_type:complete